MLLCLVLSRTTASLSVLSQVEYLSLISRENFPAHDPILPRPFLASLPSSSHSGAPHLKCLSPLAACRRGLSSLKDLEGYQLVSGSLDLVPKIEPQNHGALAVAYVTTR